MANRYLVTKEMVINLDKVSAIWFETDDDDTIVSIHIDGENLDWEIPVDSKDYPAVKEWVENCVAGKVQRNEKGIFICSHCGAPNTEAG